MITLFVGLKMMILQKIFFAVAQKLRLISITSTKKEKALERWLLEHFF